MAKSKPTNDVFICYSHSSDADVAKRIAKALKAYDLTVFLDTNNLKAGENFESAVWEAIAESKAILAIIPDEEPNAWMAFELGAAKAWNKPMYAIVPKVTSSRLPSIFRDLHVYPWSRLDEVAFSIAHSSDSLTKEETDHLVDAYVQIGVPSDQLALQPKNLAKLTRIFTNKSGRQISGEQLLSYLLRLRKRKELPPLPKKASKD